MEAFSELGKSLPAFLLLTERQLLFSGVLRAACDILYLLRRTLPIACLIGHGAVVGPPLSSQGTLE